MNGPGARGTVDGAYAEATSVVQGGRVTFRLQAADGVTLGSAVTVHDTVRDRVVLTTVVHGGSWTLDLPLGWPSSLYCARFDTPEPELGEAYFAVRSARPGAGGAVLVSVPFLTWQAYNRLGIPGEGLYLTEQPDRAVRVSFDRPGGGAAPAGTWEAPFYRWLHVSGYQADYCSNVDLHSGAAALEQYALLICAGHDEYWTWQMRDAVESFVAAGGNLAIFSGNTCWWQARLEDDLRTLVCYRDAWRDPVSGVDPARTTVTWSSAPVQRPENILTGMSFRHGAGCWDDLELMGKAAYTARFAQHWVFDGTGLRDGDAFAAGAVGYEADAAEFEEVDGVPLATGRDGGPPSLVILATADLRHWRTAGQGGHATMGVFELGHGTVFNAATVNWAHRLSDPVVARITDNVVRQLRSRRPAGAWTDIGDCAQVAALAAAEHLLFAVTVGGALQVRRTSPQNLRWQTVGEAPAIRALTAPRESIAGRAVGLYGIGADATLWYRPPVPGPASWVRIGQVPASAVDLAIAHDGLFVLTTEGGLWHAPLSRPDDDGAWRRVVTAQGAYAITGLSGRLFAVDRGARLRTRLATAEPEEWQDAGEAPGLAHLAADAGKLIAAGADGRLRWACPLPVGHR